jgi:hypothetical protein
MAAAILFARRIGQYRQKAARRSVARRFSQFKNPVTDFIPVARIADMLLNPGDAFAL